MLQVDPLKVLMAEDSPADADLVRRELRALGARIEARVVADAGSLNDALDRFVPHIVLCDFSMPGFSGLEALRIVRERAPETPFIFVSATIGEEVAIAALQAGADDYVLKDNLRRLPASVERALDNATERRERRRVERALRASEERFRTIVETTEDWIWESDLTGRLTWSNLGITRILGIPVAEAIGRRVFDFMSDTDRARFESAIPEDREGRRGWRGRTLQLMRADGSLRTLESTARPLYDEAGQLVGFRGIDRDVTQRVRQEARIQQLARIHAVLSALGQAILYAIGRQTLLDTACRIAVAQGGFTTAWIASRTTGGGVELIAGYAAPGVPTRPDLLPVLRDPQHRDQDEALLRAVLTDLEPVVIPDIRTADISASRQAAAEAAGVRAIIVLPLGDPAWGAIALYKTEPHDIDEAELSLLRRLAATIDFGLDFIAKSERLEYLAFHNPLTGLPNRAGFRERLTPMIDAHPLLIGVADAIRFHVFNDSRGRDFGDQLLCEIALRLRQTLGDEALLAHPGEDTFMFALPATGAPEHDLARFETLLAAACDRPLTVAGEQVYIALRCGLLRTPDHATDVDAAERNVVAALAEAVERDLPLLAYTDELRERSHRRIQMERELRHAIEEARFELHLQPKFDTRSKRLIGAEALLRWRHPMRGTVAPAEFIGLLEETGLIVPAGRWVMQNALAIVQRWRQNGHAGLRIAVNVSARELRQEGFVEQCAALLGACDGDPGLDVEVTESLLMVDVEQSVRVLQALRGLGCRIAIDDFGTGYSSLTYLSRLPADVLKIDRSFVAAMTDAPASLAMVTNIVNMAHSLGLRVVAEGVESEEQLKLLHLLHCDEVQGYLLGRPLPVAEFERQFLG